MWDYNRDGVIDDLDEQDYWDDVYYEEDMEEFNNKYTSYGNSYRSPQKCNDKEKFWPGGLLPTILSALVIIVLLIIGSPVLVACPPLGVLIFLQIIRKF